MFMLIGQQHLHAAIQIYAYTYDYIGGHAYVCVNGRSDRPTDRQLIAARWKTGPASLSYSSTSHLGRSSSSTSLSMLAYTSAPTYAPTSNWNWAQVVPSRLGQTRFLGLRWAPLCTVLCWASGNLFCMRGACSRSRQPIDCKWSKWRATADASSPGAVATPTSRSHQPPPTPPLYPDSASPVEPSRLWLWPKTKMAFINLPHRLHFSTGCQAAKLAQYEIAVEAPNDLPF